MVLSDKLMWCFKTHTPMHKRMLILSNSNAPAHAQTHICKINDNEKVGWLEWAGKKESIMYVYICVTQWGSLHKSELKITLNAYGGRKTNRHKIQNSKWSTFYTHTYIFMSKIAKKNTTERRLTVNKQNRTSHISRFFQWNADTDRKKHATYRMK